MKNLLFILLLLMTYSFAFTQTSLSGKITEEDEDYNEPVLFGNVVLFKEGILITGQETDFEGNYHFTAIDPGTYEVEASYLGLQTKRISDVVVQAGINTVLDIQLAYTESCCFPVITLDYTIPLIEHDNFTSGTIYTSSQIRVSPNR